MRPGLTRDNQQVDAELEAYKLDKLDRHDLDILARQANLELGQKFQYIEVSTTRNFQYNVRLSLARLPGNQ